MTDIRDDAGKVNRALDAFWAELKRQSDDPAMAQWGKNLYANRELVIVDATGFDARALVEAVLKAGGSGGASVQTSEGGDVADLDQPVFRLREPYHTAWVEISTANNPLRIQFHQASGRLRYKPRNRARRDPTENMIEGPADGEWTYGTPEGWDG